MKPQAMLAGVGALAFGILTFVAFIVANPPGGDYKVSDITDFLAKGHRPAAFISMYLVMLSGAGLLVFLARLRDSIDGDRASVFWGFGVAAATAWIAGYAVVISPTAALAFSSGHLKTLDPTLAWTISEAGYAVMYGAGGVLLGCALVTFVVGRVTVATWFRWATAVAAIASLASLAWIPMFLVYIWAIVSGIWLLFADRERVPSPSAQQA